MKTNIVLSLYTYGEHEQVKTIAQTSARTVKATAERIMQAWIDAPMEGELTSACGGYKISVAVNRELHKQFKATANERKMPVSVAFRHAVAHYGK